MSPSWRRYLRFWGPRVDDDVDAELEFHLAMRIREYVARGMSEDDARLAAERRFGPRRWIREQCLTIGHRRTRRMHRARSIDAFRQDLRYGLRALGRQRGWTAIALVTMALGIGASTAVFSVVNSLILNPLPYRDGNRVAMVWLANAKSHVMIAPGDEAVAAWRARAHSIESMEVFGRAHFTLTGRGDPTEITAGIIQPSFLSFAGTPLLAGRPFVHDEMVRGGPRVAILGEQLWRERFGGASSVLGQRLVLNDQPYIIVGVAPARLQLPRLGGEPVRVWLPDVGDSLHFAGLVAVRTRRGVSTSAATAELSRIASPEPPRSNGDGFAVQLVRPGDQVWFRSSLFLLAGAVALLLLVACANVAHLLLARGATRERELAIRTALGAGRWRLARQLLTESGLLAAAGCAIGIALAWAGVRTLSALRPDSLAMLESAHMDWRALGAATALSVFAGLVFGCAAALHAVRQSSSAVFRSSATAGSAAPRTHRLRSMLVVTEMAVSAMLLVGAALLVRSVLQLQSVNVGFDSRNLYTMALSLPRERYPSSPERQAFMARVADAARAMPGAIDVAVSTGTPPGLGGFMMSPIEVEGGPPPSASASMPLNFVAPSYFRALGVQLEGSTFGPRSAANDEIIVSRGFASTYLAGRPAIGRRLRFAWKGRGPDEGWMRVIGVAADVPAHGLIQDMRQPFMYKPIDPASAPTQWKVTVRVSDGLNPSDALRRIVTSMDHRLVPPSVSTVDAALARTIATPRFTMILLAAFAMLAVVLSAVGLYGVIAYVVAQRTREIGVRIALGATPANIARAIVARGLALSVAGLAAGLVGATWGAKLLQAELFEVTATDAASYAAAAGTLLVVSAVACLVPMRRAMRVDPVIAMRAD